MADEKRNGNGKMNGSHGMTCDCTSGCGCMCHSGMGGGRHWTFFLLRTLLTIIILMFVFWFGVMAARLGDGANGRNFMMRDYTYPTGIYNGAAGATPMMRINGATSTPTTTSGVQNY